MSTRGPPSLPSTSTSSTPIGAFGTPWGVGYTTPRPTQPWDVSSPPRRQPQGSVSAPIAGFGARGVLWRPRMSLAVRLLGPASPRGLAPAGLTPKSWPTSRTSWRAWARHQWLGPGKVLVCQGKSLSYLPILDLCSVLPPLGKQSTCSVAPWVGDMDSHSTNSFFEPLCYNLQHNPNQGSHLLTEICCLPAFLLCCVISARVVGR